MRLFTYTFLLLQCLFFSQAQAAKVLIFSDSHGNLSLLRSIFTAMPEPEREQIDYVLVNGDLISIEGIDGVNQLQETFKLIKDFFPKLQHNPKHIIVAPGNWEGTLIPPHMLLSALSSAGVYFDSRLAKAHPNSWYSLDSRFNFGSPESPFVVEYGHFPQFFLPAQYMNLEKFVYGFYPTQAHSILTMNHREPMNMGVNLYVYSHTHIPSLFYGKNTSPTSPIKLVLGTGGLDLCRRSLWDALTFSVLDTSTKEVAMNKVAVTPPQYYCRAPSSEMTDEARIKFLEAKTQMKMENTSIHPYFSAPIRYDSRERNRPLYDVTKSKIAVETPEFNSEFIFSPGYIAKRRANLTAFVEHASHRNKIAFNSEDKAFKPAQSVPAKELGLDLSEVDSVQHIDSAPAG